MAHLSKRSLANHFDCTEVIEPQLCATKPEKCRLFLSVLQELPLFPIISHHGVRLQPPLEVDASGKGWSAIRCGDQVRRENRVFRSIAASTATL